MTWLVIDWYCKRIVAQKLDRKSIVIDLIILKVILFNKVYKYIIMTWIEGTEVISKWVA